MQTSQLNGKDLVTRGGLLLDALFPVGSVYVSSNNQSPAQFLGGTWERVEDVFPLFAGTNYAAGSTGGQESVALTVAEMPYHSHNFSILGSGDRGSAEGNVTYEETWNHFQEFGYVTAGAGGNQPHNNMPPYKTFYAWERIE